jgi:hypothetical protein
VVQVHEQLTVAHVGNAERVSFQAGNAVGAVEDALGVKTAGPWLDKAASQEVPVEARVRELEAQPVARCRH